MRTMFDIYQYLISKLDGFRRKAAGLPGRGEIIIPRITTIRAPLAIREPDDLRVVVVQALMRVVHRLETMSPDEIPEDELRTFLRMVVRALKYERIIFIWSEGSREKYPNYIDKQGSAIGIVINKLAYDGEFLDRFYNADRSLGQRPAKMLNNLEWTIIQMMAYLEFSYEYNFIDVEVINYINRMASRCFEQRVIQINQGEIMDNQSLGVSSDLEGLDEYLKKLELQLSDGGYDVASKEFLAPYEEDMNNKE